MAKEQKQQMDQETVNQMVEDFLISQKTLKELKGFTDEEMEALYTTAYNYYNHGKFEDAKFLFSTLCQFDPTKPKYWMGLGASRHMLKEYERAAVAYGMATLRDAEDPHPPFHAADCFIKMGDSKNAILALEAVLEIAGENKKHEKIRKQAESLLEEVKHHKEKENKEGKKES